MDKTTGMHYPDKDFLDQKEHSFKWSQDVNCAPGGLKKTLDFF